MPRHPIRWRYRLITVLLHAAVLSLAYCGAWLLRFDFDIPAAEAGNLRAALPVLIGVKLILFVLIGMHTERWWVYQGFPDLTRLLRNNVAASVAAGAVLYFTLGEEFPRSIYLLDLLLSFLFAGGIIFSFRLLREMRALLKNRSSVRGVVVYGAGVAGANLARELRSNPALGGRVLGFLDDDTAKLGGKLMGLPILGSGDDASQIVQALKERGQVVDEILVAMPSASLRQIRAAVARAEAAGVTCKVVPGLGDLIMGKVSVGRKMEMSLSSLLGREPVQLEMDNICRKHTGRVVMVTGAAGSIGSELCRQLAGFDVALLVAFDQAESELFFLERDLRARFPHLSLVAEVGDIRDAQQVEQVITQHRVESIYHAAAYKHVPLMERQICEAVRNNVLGTWNLVQAAVRCGVQDFLLISSDKAVNPTSIMGLTKRVAELIVSSRRSTWSPVETKFVSVRFGNVLVSNGSVVPIFQKQIAAGGPVTVTDPEIRRYFMTVQEAVHLVLEASTMGRGSEIFVLDMGTPVKIVDLARVLIAQAGYIPGEDIDIEFTGLRPGEKIYEEICLDDEYTVPTDHQKIWVFQNRQLTMSFIAPWIATLQHLLWRRDAAGILEHMRVLVPEYLGQGPQEMPVESRPVQAAISTDEQRSMEPAIQAAAS